MTIIYPPIGDLGINRNPKYLHPWLFQRIQNLIARCTAAGVFVGVFEGYRSPERQAMLYTYGRTIQNPNSPATAEHPLGLHATNAAPFKSFHQFGLAADIVVDGDPVKAGYQWNWDDRKLQYETMGRFAGVCGLDWAGLWQGELKEKPHVQMPLGFTYSQCSEMLTEEKSLTGLWEQMKAAQPYTPEGGHLS